MKIGKKEIGLSTIQYIITTIASLVIMIVILPNVTTEEYAVWNIFLSIQSFVVLMDSGFGGVVLRYISYAVSGARNISKSGVPEIQEKGGVNSNLFLAIVESAKKIYGKFSILGFLILAGFSAYIYYIAREDTNIVIVLWSWVLFSVAVSIDIYYTYLSNVMKGMGKVKENSIISIIITVIASLIKVGLVLGGLGLLGLTIAYFLQIIITRFLINVFLRKDIRIFRVDASKEGIQSYKEECYEAILVNSKQMTWITVSDFITGKGKTLIVSAFLPLTVTAMFSLTNQIISIVYSLAIIPFSVLRFKWGETILQKKSEETKDVYAISVFSLIVLMTIGITATIFIGDDLLAIIGSNTKLLAWFSIILLGVYQCMIGIYKIATVYIQYHNVQPYIKSNVISSAITLVLALIILNIKGDINVYLLTLLVVHMAYNGWKWPLESLKMLGIRLREIFIRSIRRIIKASSQR